MRKEAFDFGELLRQILRCETESEVGGRESLLDGYVVPNAA
jgi:hypothetical protein